MTRVTIPNDTRNLTNNELKDKLEWYAYKLCVLSLYNDTQSTVHTIEKFEVLVLEATIRILKKQLGFAPRQNQLFENVETVFENQDAYNINRTISGIRRAKMFGMNPADEKYIKWFENRVWYAIRTLAKCLKHEKQETTHA